MPSILIIDRNSVVKPYNTKTFVEDELYKKAGFKSKEGFAKHCQWNVSIKNAPSTTTIELYGKTTGRAGQENKYDFPPPADNTLFFGSCVLVCKSGESVVDMSLAEWEKIYEQLFGGFEDIGSNDSEEDDESIDDSVPRTKEGYVKDGFIVDDTEESEDSEYEPVVSAKSKSKTPKKATSTKPKVSTKTSKKTKTPETNPPTQEFAENIQIKIHPEISEPVQEEVDPAYFSCTDELVEESYV